MKVLPEHLDVSSLQPDTSPLEVDRVAREAKSLGVACVCVKPCDVQRVAAILAGSPTRVASVIGFPHGSTFSQSKAFEADLACQYGASELDMVAAIGFAREKKWIEFTDDICAVVAVARKYGAIVKVIFETGLFQEDELKIRMCRAARKAGADFVKTSTGFAFVKQSDGSWAASGATLHDVQLLVKHADGMGVKASGGIRTMHQAQQFLLCGAIRLGTSNPRSLLGLASHEDSGCEVSVSDLTRGNESSEATV